MTNRGTFPGPAFKRAALCCGAGLGVLGALAPFESRLAGLLTAACLILLGRSLARAPFRAALAWALLATLSVGSIAFHWVVAGLVNIAGLSYWAAVPVFIIQALLFHCKVAFVVLAGRWFTRRSRLSFIWIFAGLAAAADLAFYQLFPWRFGDLAIGGDSVRQVASLAGVCGLSAVVFIEAGVILSLLRFVRRRIRGRVAARPTVSALTAPLLLLVAVYGYGFYRLTTPELSPGGTSQNVAGPAFARVGFLQPNTGPGYNEDRDDQAFAGRALNLVFNYGLKTLLAGEGRLDLLILPESAVPFFGTDERPGNEGIYSTTYHAIVAFLARYGDVDVLYNELAAATIDSSGETDGYYNLATIFNGRTGTRRASYQKRRLVPFGEYVPGEKRWPWLREIFRETSRYVAGEASGEGRSRPSGEAGGTSGEAGGAQAEAGGAEAAAPGSGEPRRHVYSGALSYGVRGPGEVSALPGLSQEDLNVLSDAGLVVADWPAREVRGQGALQPLICYEGLFPELVRELIRDARQAPDFLVNMVNDSWFGDVLENHHHESGARLRAVESGRYLIRPTLTGVSSVFDSRGREVIAPIEVGAQDVRVFVVPRLPHAWTPYIEYGDWPAWLFVWGVLIFAFWGRRVRRRKP